MKLGQTIPLEIVTNGQQASGVYAGGKKIWSRETSILWNSREFNVYNSSDSSWILNGGNGKSLVAFRFGNSDVNFGGVTWRRAVTQSNETTGTANGITVVYHIPGTAWGNIATDSSSFSNVSAFNAFVYGSDNHQVDVIGLKVGKRYKIQFVIADGRSEVNNRAFSFRLNSNVLQNPDIASPLPSFNQYAFGNPSQYAVQSFTFIATSTTLSISPSVFSSETSNISAGTQLNAIHILEDVLPPETGLYYISSSSGNDNNDGSRDRPWASLAKVNSMTFQPGDRILFKRGDTWTGRLTPQGSGTVDKPILLGAYGDGAHPKIDAAGAPWGAIALTNQSHWIIDGFEASSWANDEWYRHGIIVNNDSAGTGITIRNCIVRDVFGARNATGDVPGRHCGGITVLDRFGGCNDIIIENNRVENVVATGIQIWGPDGTSDGPLDPAKLLLRCAIRDNVVWGSACDNILYQGCRDIVVERNHSGFSGLQGTFPSAIAGLWGTRSNGGVQQYNHSHNTVNWVGGGESFDAQGLGLDMLSDGVTLIQYNFTHDNYGGPLLDYVTSEMVAGSINYRYNVSINEPRLTSGRPEEHRHNIYYSPDDVFQLHWGPQNLNIANSIVVMDQLESSIDTTTLDNNIWWNMESKPANDTNGLYLDPNFKNPLPRLITKDEYISYAAGDPNTPPATGQLERRYFGKVKNLVYNVWGAVDTFWVGRARALELACTGRNEACSLNTNLAEHAQGPLLVRLIMRNISSNDPSNWMAVIFNNTPYGAKPFVVNHNFGMLFRQNGGTQCFSGGSLISSDEFPWTDERGSNINHIISIVFSDTAGTGNAFTGNGTRVRAYSNGVLLGDYNIAQMSGCYFAYNAFDSEWRVRQLYITSRARDEDAYDDYMNMMPTSNLAVGPSIDITNAGRVNDFFNRLVDSCYPSVGAFQFNSTTPDRVETVKFIEINGRSQCRKSATVTRQYNYNTILRDRNFRIANGTVEFELYPTATGLSLNSNGVLSVAPNATSGRYVIKAKCGDVQQRFSFSVV